MTIWQGASSLAYKVLFTISSNEAGCILAPWSQYWPFVDPTDGKFEVWKACSDQCQQWVDTTCATPVCAQNLHTTSGTLLTMDIIMWILYKYANNIGMITSLAAVVTCIFRACSTHVSIPSRPSRHFPDKHRSRHREEGLGSLRGKIFPSGHPWTLPVVKESGQTRLLSV